MCVFFLPETIPNQNEGKSQVEIDEPEAEAETLWTRGNSVLHQSENKYL